VSASKKPLISIITAVRNGADHFEQTVISIESQDFRDFEFIVIDGGSTDGTLDIIERHSRSISYHVSEKDRGISDAFNKGVTAARGRVVLFLGCDDYLHDPGALGRVAEAMKDLKEPFFFYGDVNYVYADKTKRIRRNYSFRKFCQYDCLPHQAMFLDRCFFETYGLFDLNHHRAMDYEHTARFIKRFRPEYIDVLVADMRRFGVSSDPIKAHDEMDAVRLKYGLASRREIAVSRVVLRAKMAVAKLFGMNW
jgi:glycosyltransferase involved in cell wall biosynthesis